MTSALCWRPHINNVNQFVTIDSKLSLDAGSPSGNHRAMTQPCSSLYSQRIDPSRNMARYYALSIQRDLFGEICLIRSWGRIGTLGQHLSHHLASETEAVGLLQVFARQKTAKGYVPKAIHGNTEYGIECPMRGAIIDELQFAATRSQRRIDIAKFTPLPDNLGRR